MNIKAKSKKINNNMKKEELIGKKVRGFRFEGTISVNYMYLKMHKYVGKVGVIEEYNVQFDSYIVKFEDGMSYHYPAELIEHHLVVEELKYTPIAMKCNQEHFDDVRRLLESGGYGINDITDFEEHPYLVNNFTNENKVISNVFESMSGDFNRKVYHEWDKKVFLNACGIEWEEPLKEDESRYLEPTEENLKEFEKSLDQSAEEFINDANINIIDKVMNEEVIERFEKELEKGIANSKLNESCINYGKIEHDPLDDLPIIGDGVLMEVSDDEKEWHERFVVGKLKNNSFLAISDNGPAVYCWNFAQPIPKTKITRKEFESKFEIID
jgi:hypothetical protein